MREQEFTHKDGAEPFDMEALRSTPEAAKEETPAEVKEEPKVEETPQAEKPKEDNDSKESESKEEVKAESEETKDTTEQDKPQEEAPTKEEAPVAEDRSLNKEEEVEETFTTFSEWEKEFDSKKEEGDLTFQEMVQIKYEDIDSLDETDIIMKAALVEDPDMSDAELDTMMDEFEPLFWSTEERDKAIEDGDISERELKVMNSKFEKLKRTSVRALKEIQNSINLGDIQMYQNKSGSKDNTVTEDQTKAVKLAVDDHLATYDKETFEIKDKDGNQLMKMDYEITPDLKGQVSQLASDPNSVYSRWINEDGSMNMNKYMQDMTWLVGREGIMKAAYDQANSNGGESVAKDISNIDHDSKRTSVQKGDGDTHTSPHENLLKQQGY